MGYKLLFSRKIWVLFLAMALILPVTTLLVSCGTDPARLCIFAAAGTKPAVDVICEQFQEASGIETEVTYGGGGEVLSQLTLERSGELYIAPEQTFMQKASDEQAIDSDTVSSVAYMIPVIAVPGGNPGNIQNLADLAGQGVRVAVTRQETTLLGSYALEIFQKADLEEEISANIITEAARPDNLVTMLILGHVDAGILWHFYGIQNPDKIENVYLPPEQLTGIGEIQIAVTTYCQDTGAAREFIDYMTSADGKAVFDQLGYFVNADDVKEYWQ